MLGPVVASLFFVSGRLDFIFDNVVGVVVPVLPVSAFGFTTDVLNGFVVIFTSGIGCPAASTGTPS